MPVDDAGVRGRRPPRLRCPALTTRRFIGMLAVVSIIVVGHGWSFADELAGNSAGWRAGVARRCITPPELMWMSGYASRNRPAEGTLTDLWAKALVLEDPAGRRHVLVTLDLVGIDRETSMGITDAITAEHGLPREAIALATPHTHSGPVIRDNLRVMYDLDDAAWALVRRYGKQLHDAVLDAVADAIDNLQPAELSWSVGRAGFAVNRRTNP